MTYTEKVLVMVGSKIIDRAMGIITKGKLAKATVTWRQANFSVVMSGSLQSPHKCAGDRVPQMGHPLPQPTTPLHLRSCTWTTSRGMSIPHRGSPFFCLELQISMASQMSEGTVCGSICLQHQYKVPSCPTPHCTSCHILGVTHRFLLSANLPKEPECSPHCDLRQSHCWKSHSSQPGATGNPPNRNLRKVWP